MKKGAWWPIAAGGVLAATVAANGVLLYQANGRDAAVVEPDYYRRAVRWDSTLAERQRDAALGWRLDAALGALEPDGGASLAVRLADRDGRPIEGAAVRVTAISNLDAAHAVRATLAGGPGGAYAARLPLARRGLWELRFDVARGGERFSAALRRDTAPAGRP